MATRLGVYWAPGHNRPTDLEYMRQLQPPAIRILDPDVMQISQAHQAAPDALILPRDWALSEQKDDMRRDPGRTGKRHAQRWNDKIREWAGEAIQRQISLPSSNQIVVVGINEPAVWDMLPQTIEYTVSFLDECTRLGMRACALNLGVGWPANTGPDTPPAWGPYEAVKNAIKRGSHFLCCHEYWYYTGPQDGWGWYAGRHFKCPWDVPIIIGECGVDNFVDVERWNNERPNSPRGWQGHLEPQTYAAQMGWYLEHLDSRVVAVLPFLTDYRSREWQSFDTGPAHKDLLQVADDDFPGVPVEPPPPPISEWRAVVVPSAGLNIRSGPGTGHDILTAAPEDAVLGVYTAIPQWLEVEYAGTRGYSASRHLMLATTFPDATIPPGADGVSVAVRKLWDGWGGLIQTLANAYDVPVTTLAAVVLAESAGRAFDDAGRLLIRFENHIFWDLWGKDNADVFNQHFRFRRDATGNRWEGHEWKLDGVWQPAHQSNAQEWMAFVRAQGFAYEPALESTSYGLPQIMGMGYRAAGYDSAEALFRAFVADDNAHLPAMLRWIQSRGLIDELQRDDFYGFSYSYNGSGQAATYASIIERNKTQFEKLLRETDGNAG